MRWFLAALSVIVAAWCLYVASPYYALYRLGRAVQTGDVAAIEDRVHISALRYSVARQVAAEIAASEPASGITSGEAQMAAVAAATFADPILDRLLRPEGLIRLLGTSPSGEADGAPFKTSVGIDDLDDFLAASSWRGFRNVYVHLPPGRPKDQRFRAQLRLSNLRWRLVSLELPATLVRRLATDLRLRLRR